MAMPVRRFFSLEVEKYVMDFDLEKEEWLLDSRREAGTPSPLLSTLSGINAPMNACVGVVKLTDLLSDEGLMQWGQDHADLEWASGERLLVFLSCRPKGRGRVFIGVRKGQAATDLSQLCAFHGKRRDHPNHAALQNCLSSNPSSQLSLSRFMGHELLAENPHLHSLILSQVEPAIGGSKATITVKSNLKIPPSLSSSSTPRASQRQQSLPAASADTICAIPALPASATTSTSGPHPSTPAAGATHAPLEHLEHSAPTPFAPVNPAPTHCGLDHLIPPRGARDGAAALGVLQSTTKPGRAVKSVSVPAVSNLQDDMPMEGLLTAHEAKAIFWKEQVTVPELLAFLKRWAGVTGVEADPQHLLGGLVEKKEQWVPAWVLGRFDRVITLWQSQQWELVAGPPLIADLGRLMPDSFTPVSASTDVDFLRFTVISPCTVPQPQPPLLWDEVSVRVLSAITTQAGASASGLLGQSALTQSQLLVTDSGPGTTGVPLPSGMEAKRLQWLGLGGHGVLGAEPFKVRFGFLMRKGETKDGLKKRFLLNAVLPALTASCRAIRDRVAVCATVLQSVEAVRAAVEAGTMPSNLQITIPCGPLWLFTLLAGLFDAGCDMGCVVAIMDSYNYKVRMGFCVPLAADVLLSPTPSYAAALQRVGEARVGPSLADALSGSLFYRFATSFESIVLGAIGEQLSLREVKTAWSFGFGYQLDGGVVSFSDGSVSAPWVAFGTEPMMQRSDAGLADFGTEDGPADGFVTTDSGGSNATTGAAAAPHGGGASADGGGGWHAVAGADGDGGDGAAGASGGHIDRYSSTDLYLIGGLPAALASSTTCVKNAGDAGATHMVFVGGGLQTVVSQLVRVQAYHPTFRHSVPNETAASHSAPAIVDRALNNKQGSEKGTRVSFDILEKQLPVLRDQFGDLFANLNAPDATACRLEVTFQMDGPLPSHGGVQGMLPDLLDELVARGVLVFAERVQLYEREVIMEFMQLVAASHLFTLSTTIAVMKDVASSARNNHVDRDQLPALLATARVSSAVLGRFFTGAGFYKSPLAFVKLLIKNGRVGCTFETLPDCLKERIEAISKAGCSVISSLAPALPLAPVPSLPASTGGSATSTVDTLPSAPATVAAAESDAAHMGAASADDESEDLDLAMIAHAGKVEDALRFFPAIQAERSINAPCRAVVVPFDHELNVTIAHQAKVAKSTRQQDIQQFVAAAHFCGGCSAHFGTLTDLHAHTSLSSHNATPAADVQEGLRSMLRRKILCLSPAAASSEGSHPLDSVQQGIAVRVVKEGGLTLLLGAAGSGKTLLSTTLVRALQLLYGPERVAAAAYTGAAAERLSELGVAASTLHSFFALSPELEKMDAKVVVERWKTCEAVGRKLLGLKVLLIDEFSLLPERLMALLELGLRLLCGGFLPFGGVQVILVGDPLQLLPFSDLPTPPPPCFETELVRNFFTVYKLSTNHRQHVHGASEAVFLEMLGKARMHGVFSVPDFLAATQRFDWGSTARSILASGSPQQLASHVWLCATRLEVCKCNERMLQCFVERLPGSTSDPQGAAAASAGPAGEIETMPALTLGETDFGQVVVNDLLESLQLVVGAPVMALINKPDLGYHNGSLGTVQKFQRSFGGKVTGVVVRFRSLGAGKDVTVERVWGQLVRAGQTMVDRGIGLQFPLRLAFAMTVHKSQGHELTAVTLHSVSKMCRSKGQLYTAMSRVRSPHALSLALDQQELTLVMRNLADDRAVRFWHDAPEAILQAQRDLMRRQEESSIRVCHINGVPMRAAAKARGWKGKAGEQVKRKGKESKGKGGQEKRARRGESK